VIVNQISYTYCSMTSMFYVTLSVSPHLHVSVYRHSAIQKFQNPPVARLRLNVKLPSLRTLDEDYDWTGTSAEMKHEIFIFRSRSLTLLSKSGYAARMHMNGVKWSSRPAEALLSPCRARLAYDGFSTLLALCSDISFYVSVPQSYVIHATPH
jgi:hypothetical protein